MTDENHLPEIDCQHVGQPGCALPAVQMLAARLEERIVAQSVEYGSLRRRMKDLEDVVHGNGKEGLKTVLDRVARDIRLIRWVGTIAGGGGLVYLAERLLMRVFG